MTSTRRWLAYAVAMIAVGSTTAQIHGDVVGLWRFDGEVNPQPDLSGNNNDAEVFDATWTNDAERGGVMRFDGEGDNNPVNWLEVEDSDSLSIEDTGLTIATWANFAQFDTWNSVMGKTGESSMNKPSPFDLYTNRGTGIPRFYVGEGNGPIAFSDAFDPPEADEWVHTAVTMDEDGEIVHYLNGEENGEGFIDRELTLLIDEDTPLFIGSRADGTTNMHGMLDDVAIFNEALSGDQIMTIMGGDFSEFGVGGGLVGDFNADGLIDDVDIDLLSAAVLAGDNDAAFDLTSDGNVDNADRLNWIVDIKDTYAGDSNLDGEFNSTDFVLVFSRGEYEDDENGNSGWSDGDWNGDGDFNSSDFVIAFSDAGYEQGPRPAAAPEPTAATLAILGCLFGASKWRRSK